MDSLDLYARIEPYIGFYEEYEALYKKYLEIVKSLHVKNVLDVGCGNGKFLKHLQKSGYEALGIERSAQMVHIAQSLGVDAKVAELSSLKPNSYDVVVAIGDVLNYIKPEKLDDFFLHVSQVLKEGGFFIADVNTLEGFSVADGVMVNSNDEGFLAIEANFVDNILDTEINFFEKKGDIYNKITGNVQQYFHPKKYFKKQKSLRYQKSYMHSMFSDLDEKEIMLFKKVI